jgi:hypothetical protein
MNAELPQSQPVQLGDSPGAQDMIQQTPRRAMDNWTGGIIHANLLKLKG